MKTKKYLIGLVIILVLSGCVGNTSPKSGIDKETGSGAQITWNFETGDLSGWTKEGTAFDNQPTYGDNPTARNRGMPSNHQGNYWIGGYENYRGPNTGTNPGDVQGDEPIGKLTSRTFTINGNKISFLMGGGNDIKVLTANLIIDGKVILSATGKNTETMERVEWDVSNYKGKKANILLIDNYAGGWGHINFDDVQFDVPPTIEAEN